MEVELVRLFANALADADHGVGACLALVPREAGDPLPGPRLLPPAAPRAERAPACTSTT